MGYDATDSNPFATGGDPAYRSKIFQVLTLFLYLFPLVTNLSYLQATEMDNDGRYALDAGITASDMLECRTNEAATTVTNFKEFKGKQLKFHLIHIPTFQLLYHSCSSLFRGSLGQLEL